MHLATDRNRRPKIRTPESDPGQVRITSQKVGNQIRFKTHTQKANVFWEKCQNRA